MIPLADTPPDIFPSLTDYAILEQLYLGSRTAVYRAITPQQQSVVIKILRREYPSFGELVQFRNQYTIAKNLPIPGIVRPLSMEPYRNGYALVMEDVGSIPLGDYAQQPLAITEVLTIALQMADILHDLFQHQVIHKDIKPANILINPESKQIKLIDFSIASVLPRETQEIQSPNILEGTLAYLAPEQTGRMNRSIDYRADFYALGITLYELLTGTLPFTSEDPLELVHCHIAKVPLSANQIRSEVPSMIVAIVTKLMAKNAEDRYQSALGLKHDLEQCLTAWKNTGEIPEFELGTRDLSDRGLISETISDRETDVQSKLAEFDRIESPLEETGQETFLFLQKCIEAGLEDSELLTRLKETHGNDLHNFELITAEIHRIQGQKLDAIDLYDRAIAGAKANGYHQEEALANELAAKFYLDWGKEKVAAGYMQEAYYCYAHCGAIAKIEDLEHHYPHLLQPILQKPQQSLSVLATLASIAVPNRSIHRSTQVEGASSTSLNQTLDFATVLKASQSLSGTIQLDELLHQLTQIILQHSGGDRCALILPNVDGDWQAQAIATPERTELCAESLEGNSNIPVKLLQYVKNTQEIVIIEDCKTDLPVLDEYFKQYKPKSLICLPILNQGQLLGILYLRNRSTRGVFTNDRVLILNFLCTQAAISLENARLYHQEQQKRQEITQKEAEYRSIFESVNDGLGICDLATGQTVAVNPANCKMNGYEPEEWPYLTPADYLHPDYLHSFTHYLETLRAGKEFYTKTICKRKDGSFFDAEVKAVPFIYKGTWHGLTIIRDISEQQAARRQRKQAEAALVESETKFRRLVEDANDVIWSSHLDSTLTYLSPQFKEIFGWETHEWVGQSFGPLVHPEDLPSLSEFIHQVITTGKKAAGQEFRHSHPDGRLGWLTSNISPIKDEQGQVIGLQGILRDITDRKVADHLIKEKNVALEKAFTQLQQSQAQVVQSEKMSALGNLVAGVAHEINNPIGFLNGSINNAEEYVQDLLKQLALYQQHYPTPIAAIQDHAEEIELEFLSDDLPKLLHSMQGATDRIKGISTSLRTFSRADSDHKVISDLHEGLDSTLLILKYRIKANSQRPAIDIIQDYGKLPQLKCFPGQLNQVFMNILANAIDMFDEMAQHQSWEELQKQPQQITIRTLNLDHQVQIGIQDNGIGMTEAVKDKIFDHLFTTKDIGKGTGLGLAIARQIIVDKHGGKLEVDSIQGQGTTFSITIPIADQDQS